MFHLVWGSEVDRALRPVLAVSLVGSAAFSAGWSFVGVWAVEELGATRSQLGVAFLVAAVVGMVVGYAGGHASDYVGRKPMILLGWVTLALTFVGYGLAGHNVLLGLALMSVAAIGGSVGGGADQAMVADLVAPERHEARVRVGAGRVQPRRRLRPAHRRAVADRKELVALFSFGIAVLSACAIAAGRTWAPSGARPRSDSRSVRSSASSSRMLTATTRRGCSSPASPSSLR